LEGLTLLRRERLEQLLDGRIDVAKDGHANEETLDADEDATTHDVGGERAHEQDEEHRGQKAQTGDPLAEKTLVARREELVDGVPEDVQEPGGRDGGDSDEKTSNEAYLDPIADGTRHGQVMTPQGWKQVKQSPRQSAPVAGGTRRLPTHHPQE